MLIFKRSLLFSAEIFDNIVIEIEMNQIGGISDCLGDCFKQISS